MKKFCLILAVCLILGCLSGCGSSSEATETTAATQAPTETQETTLPPTVETTEPTEPTEPKIIGYDLDIPEGFEINTSEDDRAIYLCKDPSDSSSIVIRIQPLDESVLNMDEDAFKTYQALQQEYEELALQPNRPFRFAKASCGGQNGVPFYRTVEEPSAPIARVGPSEAKGLSSEAHQFRKER